MPRAKQPAHVYTRPGRNGFWAYLDRDNRHIPLEADDEEAAHTELSNLLSSRRLRVVEAGAPTLESLARDEIESAEATNTPKTASEIDLNLTRVLRWLDGEIITHARQVTREVIERYVMHRRTEDKDEQGTVTRKAVSAARVNRELDSLKRLLHRAVRQGHAPDTILEAFTSRRSGGLKLREARPAPHERRLSKKEIDRFLKKADTRYVPLFRLMAGTGLRDDEARHLRTQDVTKTAIVVSPNKPGDCQCHPDGWKTKGYRYRRIPISPDTYAAVEAWLGTRSNVYQEPKTVWKVVQKGAAAAKLPAFSLHDLRRSYASILHAAGISVPQIAKLMGHADVITTTRYLGIVEDEISPRDLPI